MAGRARRSDARLSVRRVGSPVEIFYVAAVTICRRPLIFSADVAGEAVQCSVGARQGK